MASFFDFLQVRSIVSDFQVFLAKRNDDSDSSKGLLRIACALAISFCTCQSSVCHYVPEDSHTNEHDWGDAKHGEGERPSLVETGRESGEAHAVRVDDVSVLSADSVLNCVSLLGDARGQFHVVCLVIPSTFLIENGSQVSCLDLAGDAGRCPHKEPVLEEA